MKSDAFANDLALLIYKATAFANVADNADTSPITDIYLALHTAYPGLGNTQDQSECDYTDYARVAVARGAGFDVSGRVVTLAADEDFPENGDGTGDQEAFWWSTGPGASGATDIFDMGPIGSVLGPFCAATDDNITIPGLSGLAEDDRIAFEAIAGSSLPTGITAGVAYWVISVSSDVITVSTTEGGGAVDITAAGDGIAYRLTPITITEGVIPRLKAATSITW